MKTGIDIHPNNSKNDYHVQMTNKADKYINRSPKSQLCKTQDTNKVEF